MVSRFALVLAERAHLVLVLSAPGGLEVRVGHWGWSQAHEFAQRLREGPQPVLHAGQDAVVAWRTRTGRVSRWGRGGETPRAKLIRELPGLKPSTRGLSTRNSRHFPLPLRNLETIRERPWEKRRSSLGSDLSPVHSEFKFKTPDLRF